MHAVGAEQADAEYRAPSSARSISWKTYPDIEIPSTAARTRSRRCSAGGTLRAWIIWLVCPVRRHVQCMSNEATLAAASGCVGASLVVWPDCNGVSDAGGHSEHETVAAAKADGVHDRHARQLFTIAPGGQFAFEQFLHHQTKLLLHPWRQAPRIALETACGLVECAEWRRRATLPGATRATHARSRRSVEDGAAP